MTLKYVYENLLIRQLLQKKEETGTQQSYCTQFSKFGRIFLWIKNILKFISVSLRWEKRGILLTKTSPVKQKSDYTWHSEISRKSTSLKKCIPRKLPVLRTKDVKPDTFFIRIFNF